MKVYVASVMSDCGDHYTYLYSVKPTEAQVIERIWMDAGEGDSALEWYKKHCVVDIHLQEVLDF